MGADYSRNGYSKLTLNHSMLPLKLSVCRESPRSMLTRLFCSGQMSRSALWTTDNSVIAANSAVLSGAITGDSVQLRSTSLSGSIADKNVGTAKTINVTGINVTGTDAGNYTFNTTATTAADITARALTVSATGQNRVYDGTTAARLRAAERVTHTTGERLLHRGLGVRQRGTRGQFNGDGGTAAIRAGAGIGFLSRHEAQGDPDLIEIMPPRPEWDAQLWLVTHVDLHRTPKVQAFLAHIKQAAQGWAEL